MCIQEILGGCLSKCSLKEFDKAASPAHPPTKSTLRGCFFLVAYLGVAATLTLYLYDSHTKEYAYTTSIESFSRDSCVEESEVCEYMLPPLNCISDSGCFVKMQMGTSSDSMNSCTYVAQGEAIPDSLRYIYYASDPIDLMTILSVDGASRNFAVSYDFEEISAYKDPLETTTLEASTDFGMYTPMPLKIYKGTSVMQLVKTVGVAAKDVVYTWSNLVTSTEMPEPGNIGACCSGGSDMVTFVNADGTDFSGNYPSCGTDSLDEAYFVTTFQAPPTLTVVSVQNPFDATVIIALIGGWVGSFELAAFLVSKLTKPKCHRSKKATADVDGEFGDVELGNDVQDRVQSRKKAAAALTPDHGSPGAKI